MGIHAFASRRTFKSLVTGDLTLTLVNGEPVQICGILFDNNTGASIHVTINDADGTKSGSVSVPGCQSFELETHWLADAGLQLVADATGIDVTVYHNSPGN